MKAIILVLSPKECMNLLNGYLSILVRKKFPSNYVGWVYVYCKKKDYEIVFGKKRKVYLCDMRGKTESGYDFMVLSNNEDNEKFTKDNLNGKVIGRFWCDKVEEVKFNMDYVFGGLYNIKSYSNEKCFERDCCLSQTELDNYLNKNNNKRDKVGTAIHITGVQPFNEPKDIKEFGKIVLEPRFFDGGEYYEEDKYFLTHAPSTYCYIKI